MKEKLEGTHHDTIIALHSLGASVHTILELAPSRIKSSPD
jgi:predicted esterase